MSSEPFQIHVVYEGDIVGTGILEIEEFFKKAWAALDKSIKEKDYASARLFRSDIQTFWKLLFKNTLVRINPLDDVRQILYNYFVYSRYKGSYKGARTPASSEISNLINKALNSNEARPKLNALVQDDWLEDLCEEYGKQKLSKIKLKKAVALNS